MPTTRNLFARILNSPPARPGPATRARGRPSGPRGLGSLGLGARLRWHRRSLAAALAAATLLIAVGALRPHGPAGACGPPTSTTPVLVAAHDVPGGAVLTERDVRPVALPRAFVPAGAAPATARLAGRVLAGPMRAGEPVTDVRLVGASLLAGFAGAGGEVVAAPVRVTDAQTVRLVRAGDLVDVLAADLGPPAGSAGSAGPDTPVVAGPSGPAGPPGARVVVSRARVVLVPRDEPGNADTAHSGALVVLATAPADAVRLARAAASAQLSLALRPG